MSHVPRATSAVHKDGDRHYQEMWSEHGFALSPRSAAMVLAVVVGLSFLVAYSGIVS